MSNFGLEIPSKPPNLVLLAAFIRMRRAKNRLFLNFVAFPALVCLLPMNLTDKSLVADQHGIIKQVN